MAQDIRESIVGSYLRYIESCEVVVYNTHTPGVQGEIVVIGLKQGRPPAVWLCESDYAHWRRPLRWGYAGTVAKIRDKVERARDFAAVTFPDERHLYEIWSPVVPSGAVAFFDELEKGFDSAALDLRFGERLVRGACPRTDRSCPGKRCRYERTRVSAAPDLDAGPRRPSSVSER